MFDTNNLADEKLTQMKRRRLYGPYKLQDVKVDHALFSPSKGALYLMSGASKIFKIYAKLLIKPHTALSRCIVGVEGAERLAPGTIRAIDVIDHVAEVQGPYEYYYSRLILHTQKGACTILCQDVPGKGRGCVALQMEEADRYPPADSAPLEDFKLPLPSVRTKDA